MPDFIGIYQSNNRNYWATKMEIMSVGKVGACSIHSVPQHFSRILNLSNTPPEVAWSGNLTPPAQSRRSPGSDINNNKTQH